MGVLGHSRGGSRFPHFSGGVLQVFSVTQVGVQVTPFFMGGGSYGCSRSLKGGGPSHPIFWGGSYGCSRSLKGGGPGHPIFYGGGSYGCSRSFKGGVQVTPFLGGVLWVF